MATVFDDFKREFDRMSKDEQVQLGMAGLVQMYKEDYSGNPRRSSSRSNMGGRMGSNQDNISISGIGSEVGVSVNSIDADSFDPLVKKMAKQTYTVRLTGIFGQVVQPLKESMEMNRIKDQIYFNRLHWENILYYRGIIEAVNNLGKTNADNFLDATLMMYHNFMRHPIWNTVKLMNNVILKPMARLTAGILFGFKKRETDTEKIVRAIHEQTEYQRTGKIGKESNGLVRLFRTGLIPSLTRSMVSIVSHGDLGIDAAREAEEKRSKGETLNIFDRLSKKFYGGFVDQLGTDNNEEKSFRNTTVSFYNQTLYHERETVTLLNAMRYSMHNGFENLISFQQDETRLFREMLVTMSALQTVSDITSPPHVKGNRRSSGGSMDHEILSQVISDMWQNGAGAAAREDARERADKAKEEARRDAQAFDHMGETKDLFEQSLETQESMDKTLGKIRRTQVAERVMAWLRTGVSIAANTITSIGSAISGAIAGAIGGTILGMSTRALVRGAIPVSLMFAAFSLTDWLKGKLGIPEDSTPGNAYDFLENTRRAKQSPEYQAMAAEIAALKHRKEQMIRDPGYQVNIDAQQETLRLDAEINELKRKQVEFLRKQAEKHQGRQWQGGSFAPTGNPKKDAFLDKYHPHIMAVAERTGVAPEVIAAQFGLETGWGKGVVGNNLGNIKAGSSWTGPTQRQFDRAELSYDKYRVYDSPDAFADDYVKLMQRNWPNAMGTGSDVGGFASGLRNGTYGAYATDPNYQSKLESIANSLSVGSPASNQGRRLTLDSPGVIGAQQVAAGGDRDLLSSIAASMSQATEYLKGIFEKDDSNGSNIDEVANSYMR